MRTAIQVALTTSIGLLAAPCFAQPEPLYQPQLAQATAVAEFSRAVVELDPNSDVTGTEYRIQKLLVPSDLQVGELVIVPDLEPFYVSTMQGDTVLLSHVPAREATRIFKARKLTVEEAAFLLQAPDLEWTDEADAIVWLQHYLPHVFHDHTLLGDAAISAVERSPATVLQACAKDLPREEMKARATNPKTRPKLRAALCIMLSGLTNPDESQFLRERMEAAIAEQCQWTSHFVLPYLLCDGETGVDYFEQNWIQPHLAEVPVPSKQIVSGSDPISAYINLASMLVTDGDSQLPRERVLLSLRGLLKSNIYQSEAVWGLTVARDWTQQKDLYTLWASLLANDDAIELRRQIAEYMVISTRDVPDASKKSEPEHITNGKAFIADMRNRDPRIFYDLE